MPHTHSWRVSDYVLLALPDVDDFADRFTSWRCTGCGQQDALSGCIRMGEPLHDPPWWIAMMGVRTLPLQGQGPRRLSDASDRHFQPLEVRVKPVAALT